MKQIYKSLKESVCPVLVSRASRVLGEKEGHVKEASESIIASILGIMIKKGDTQQIKNILNEASNLNILAQAENLCEENPTEDQRKIGDDFLQQLLGDKAADFTNPIAAHSGISKVAANRMISMIAPLLAGHLGDLLQKDKRSLAALIGQIKEEKNSFAAFIPSGLAERFRLHTAGNTVKTAAALASSPKPSSTSKPTTPKVERVEPTKEKGGSNWWMWLLLLLLMLLLFFWWRSCQSNENVSNISQNTEVKAAATPEPSAPVTIIPTATTSNDKSTVELTLPDGQKISVLKGSMEEEMVKFLNSNEYANATANELKNKWFEFDNIDFEYNSTTQLMDKSKAQLKNLMTIIKSYPDTKIVVAGFADKKGTEEVNLEVSKERALTIEKYFEKEGLNKQVLKIDGFGEKYATRSLTASDSERAKDRDIALRFVK